MTTTIQRIRIKQIRVCSRWLNRFSMLRPLRPVLKAARPLLHPLTGYRRPFATLADAETAVARYSRQGHANPDNARIHLELAQKPRPSDYAALFHINAALPDIRTVFDLGGNAGNLYYSYSRHLPFHHSLAWTVFDLPAMTEIGRRIAAEKSDRRLRFSHSFDSAEAADLFIASGSLHYFPQPLPELIANLKAKPKYILINRTPLTDAEPTATIQDAGAFLVACRLYNKQDLLRGFDALGYDLIDSWSAEELSVQIPCYPELSVPSYSGMFLRNRSIRTTSTSLELGNYLPVHIHAVG